MNTSSYYYHVTNLLGIGTQSGLGRNWVVSSSESEELTLLLGLLTEKVPAYFGTEAFGQNTNLKSLTRNKLKGLKSKNLLPL